jgi:RNA polymerase sigma-70 factor (ECF subfamily)
LKANTLVHEQEKSLVGRVIKGESAAEEEFFKMYRPRLLRACHYFLGGRESDAEDIVQETFIIALPRLKDYVFKAPIFAWLRQISLRLCYTRLRKRKKQMASLEQDLELYLQRIASDRIEIADLELQKLKRLEVLVELKKQLNAGSAEVIELRNVRGLSYLEISDQLNIPIGTVMSRLARARDQLRDLLENSDEEGKALPPGPLPPQ